MIRYVGGKTRHAKEIGAILLAESRDCNRYIEPFFGGGSMAKITSAMSIPRLVSDINPDLIELFQAIQDGWLPPERISGQTYQVAKGLSPSPLRTYIGFA